MGPFPSVSCGLAIHFLDPRQDGVANGVEGLSDECGAHDSGGITRPERIQAATPAPRGRQREQVFQQIDDIFQVVTKPDTIYGVTTDLFTIQDAQCDWAAYSRVI